MKYQHGHSWPWFGVMKATFLLYIIFTWKPAKRNRFIHKLLIWDRYIYWWIRIYILMWSRERSSCHIRYTINDQSSIKYCHSLQSTVMSSSGNYIKIVALPVMQLSILSCMRATATASGGGGADSQTVLTQIQFCVRWKSVDRFPRAAAQWSFWQWGSPTFLVLNCSYKIVQCTAVARKVVLVISLSAESCQYYVWCFTFEMIIFLCWH